MDHEAAQERLAQRRRPGAALTRLGRAARIPGAVRAFAREVLEQQDAYTRHRLIESRRGAIAPLFAGLNERARKRLIHTLLPHIEEAVEAGWELLAVRPYQHGLTRKPFRCPRCGETLADRRGAWLLGIAATLGDIDEDIEWVAAWAPYLAGWAGAADLGWLLAGAIDAGGASGERVLEILKQSATGEHEVGRMGRHVTQALMSCGRQDAWEFVERLLLAAQRQEGLRQAILEAVDESHPGAFRRMIRLIREEKLARFSSVVRAFDTWFGFMWDGSSGIKVDEVLGTVERFFEDAGARDAALAGAEPEPAYLALWTMAFDDVDAAIPPAIELLRADTAELRFVATHFLVQTMWSEALAPLAEALRDPDLRVAAHALGAFLADRTQWAPGELVFERLEALHGRIPKRAVTLQPIVWPWWRITLEKRTVAAAMVLNRSAVPIGRVLPYVRDLDPPQRASVLRHLAGVPAPWPAERAAQQRKREPLSAEIRGLALDMLGDASAEVRTVAFDALAGSRVEDDEVDRLIALLGRQAGDLRSACLARLQTLDADRLETSIERLLADADAQRRTAGLELLRHASAAGRLGDRAPAIAERYHAAHADVGETERSHLDAVLGGTDRPPALDDALGLVAPGTLRTWPDPRARDVALDTPAARACLLSLARLVLEHQATEVEVGGEVRTLVAAPQAVPHPGSAETAKDKLERLPLADVWRAWLVNREPALRDADGLELVRLLALESGAGPWAAEEVVRLDGGQLWRPGEQILRRLLAWCVYWQPPGGGAEFLVDAFEAALAALTAGDFEKLIRSHTRDGVVYPNAIFFDSDSRSERIAAARDRASVVRDWRELHPGRFEGELATHFYGLLRWFQARARGLNDLYFELEDFLSAYRAGGADEAEFLDLLVGPTAPGTFFELLRRVSGRSPKELAGHPALLEAVERCRRRIVEIESRRGDRMTAASPAAMTLRWTGGLETLAAALPALGAAKFARSDAWLSAGEARKDVLSRLVLRSTPREGDTPEAFAAWAKQAKLTPDRLVELAVYAPQWTRHVQHVLGWPGFESAVWWLEAHTKDDRSWQHAELKEIWAAQIAEHTPLAASELTEGAVDVAWFRAAYTGLGAERWKKLDRAARYASSAGGHKRAQLFAQAMLGEVDEAELVRRIEQKRHQDAVRAFGLLPIAEGEAGKQDVLRRYRVLQEFRRGSRQFGSQRQQSEGRAFAIGLANLARTAGYADPLRLQWAMERELVADLAEGPVTRTKGDVELTLRLSDEGQPELEVRKGGRALKSVPAALRKDPEVAELRGRVTEIRRQASRVKRALEEAMCRGDTFTGPELQELLRHPLLAPALSRLVFAAEGTTGYAVEGGRALRDHTGRLEAIGTTERLRIAHPCDLLERGDWAAWQRDCFRAERVQPFKQVFRELYVPTAAERGQKQSSRYAGHQVNPRQAVALLGQRGWVAHPEEGVHRTFHDEGLTARLYFQETFYTPAEIEGLTLEMVCFTRKGEYEELWLRHIPARVFSETMRDLDLVVSVAHQGGVDPEATASTVEMRAALLRETCELLGLDNVELQANHAIVRGELATYSVHLGSALAGVLPGAALYIVAVHSQHRGRLFLPFADDDPRTAEVLAKVLLLARDREIKDPSILEQIRSATRGVPA